MSRTGADLDESGFDPARERAIDRLLIEAQATAAMGGGGPADLRADLEQLLIRAEALAELDPADPAFMEDSVGFASQTLGLAVKLGASVVRRVVGRFPRNHVFERATGMSAYPTALDDVIAVLRRLMDPGHSELAPRLLVSVAIETLEVVVARNRALAPGAPEIFSPARSKTIEEVRAAAASALADGLDEMALDDWQEEQGAGATRRDLLGYESTPEASLMELVRNLHLAGRDSWRGHHEFAFRYALGVLEFFAEDPLPAIVARSATAIDGSALGGGAAPWVAVSVDASILDAIGLIGPLAAVRQGDDSTDLWVVSTLNEVAQRELVLLWWLRDSDEDRAPGAPG